jgi:hypothetical protein
LNSSWTSTGKLVKAIAAFDADVDDIPVAAADQEVALAFDAYRRFSDTADAKVVAAARTGDQEEFDAANAAFIAGIRGNPPELENMRAAGIQCNARCRTPRPWSRVTRRSRELRSGQGLSEMSAA